MQHSIMNDRETKLLLTGSINHQPKYTKEANEQNNLTKDTGNTACHETAIFHGSDYKEISTNSSDNVKTQPNKDTAFGFFKNLPRRKKLILLYSMIIRFIITASLPIFNPVFPREAEVKHINDTSVNISYGVLYLVVFFTAPIIGRYLTTLGPRFVFIISIYTGVIANFCFAILHYCPDGSIYLSLILLSRCALAISYAGMSTVTQAITCFEYQENMAIANGLMQTSTIFAYSIGPALSGFLYEAGGYITPFCVLGGLLLFSGVIIHASLPSINIIDSKNDDSSMLKLLKNPLQLFALLCVFAGTGGICNIDSTLTLHLTPFGISMGMIGLVFVLMDASDTIISAAMSFIVHKFRIEPQAITIGFLVSGIGYLILAPAPFLPFISYSLVSICIGVAIIGVAYGCTIMPIINCMVIAATEVGYEKNDLNMLAIISGLFNSVYMLGGFFGQFVIGIVDTKLGRDIGFTAIGIFQLFCSLSACLLFLSRWCKNKQPGDLEK